MVTEKMTSHLVLQGIIPAFRVIEELLMLRPLWRYLMFILVTNIAQFGGICNLQIEHCSCAWHIWLQIRCRIQ